MAANEQAYDGARIVLYVVAVLLLLLGVFAADSVKKAKNEITVARDGAVQKTAHRSKSGDADEDFEDDTTISMTGLG